MGIFDLPPLRSTEKRQRTLWALMPRPARDVIPPANAVVMHSWFCCPEFGYCGAGEKGIRCDMLSCVNRGKDHDPGDEHRIVFDDVGGKRGAQSAPHATQQGATTPGQSASSAAGNVAKSHPSTGRPPKLGPPTSPNSLWRPSDPC